MIENLQRGMLLAHDDAVITYLLGFIDGASLLLEQGLSPEEQASLEGIASTLARLDGGVGRGELPD
jgi:hypothetical protein